MQATEIIAKFTNEEYGITSYAAKIEGGFSVALKDDDADEFVGIVLIFNEKDSAIKKAKGLVA